MAITKEVLCLANSRKLGGSCIAGLELAAGAERPWIRPVSSRPHEEVSLVEQRYSDGRVPRVLDIIATPLIGPKPHGYQRENWLLDPTKHWEQHGRFSVDDLRFLADAGGSLWENGFSTYYGLNDQVPVAVANGVDHSLRFIHVQSCRLDVYASYNKRRVQGVFRFDGKDYKLRVTDALIEKGYLAKEDGQYESGECYLTVSLGEPFEGNAYKLVAAVIPAAGGVA